MDTDEGMWRKSKDHIAVESGAPGDFYAPTKPGAVAAPDSLDHVRDVIVCTADTARCTATVRDRLSDAGAKARIAAIPPDIAEQIPLDLLGLIAGLPAEMAQIPSSGISSTTASSPDDRLDSHLVGGAGASEAGVVVLHEVVGVIPRSWFTSKQWTCESAALELVSTSGGIR